MRHQHIRILREEPINERKPQKPPLRQPPADPSGYGRRLKRSFDALMEADTEIPGFDNRRLLKLEVVAGFRPDDFTAIPGVAAEADKLDGWADDLKAGLEREIKELDRHIREVKRAAAGEVTLEAKLARQREQRELEQKRSRLRRKLFDRQDEIDGKRDALIAEMEVRLMQNTSISQMLVIRWLLI